MESYTLKGELQITNIEVFRLLAPGEVAALPGGGPHAQPEQQMFHCQQYCYSHQRQKDTRQHFVAARQLLPGKA